MWARFLYIVLYNASLTYTLAHIHERKTQKYSRSAFTPACLHCHVACCALFYNSAIVQRSALYLRRFERYYRFFDWALFEWYTKVQNANVCAHRKFRCGRYDVPIRIAIFGKVVEFAESKLSFRTGMRNVGDKKVTARNFWLECCNNVKRTKLLTEKKDWLLQQIR